MNSLGAELIVLLVIFLIIAGVAIASYLKGEKTNKMESSEMDEVKPKFSAIDSKRNKTKNK